MKTLILWALQAALVSAQRADSTAGTASRMATTSTAVITSFSSSSITAQTTPGPTTAPPCCWFAGFMAATLGVLGNFYYTSTAVQTVATVYSTVLDYGDREEIANVSTSYMPQEEVFTRFGIWPRFDGRRWTVNSELASLGIPSTLVDGSFYDATAVYKAGSLSVLGPPSPTPWLEWAGVQVFYDYSTSCFSTTRVDYESGSPVATRTVPYTPYLPAFITLPSIEVATDVPGAYTTRLRDGEFDGMAFYVQTLPVDAPQPTPGYYSLPSEAIEHFMSFQTSVYPWITDCIPVDMPGEPTVHIAVDQLTETSRVTIMMARPTIHTTTQPQPQPTRNVPEPPITPSPSPPAESTDESIPVQTPAIANSDSTSSPAQDVKPTQTQTVDTVSDAVSIQDQRTSDVQLSTNFDKTRSEAASPAVASSSASSSLTAPDPSQDDRSTPDNDGDGIPSSPPVVAPGAVSASASVQDTTLANTPASASSDTAVADGSISSDSASTAPQSTSASRSAAEDRVGEQTTASEPSAPSVPSESTSLDRADDSKKTGAASSADYSATATTSGTVALDQTTRSGQGTDVQASGTVASGDGSSIASTSSSFAPSGGIGDAIMSGIGQTGARNGTAGYTGPAYTGSAPGTMVNIVVAASLGLTWLAWSCM